MSNSRFLLTNLVETATLKNGTGGGAPAREETSPYVMERVQYGDRYCVWSTSAAPGSPVQVDFDMGSAKTVGAWAMLGCRSASGDPFYPDIYYASVYPGGPWTLKDSGSFSTARDQGAQFSSTQSARYWRFSIVNTGVQFSIGRLWLGAVTDLGVWHSPGATSSPFRNRIEQGQANGTFVLNDLGDPGRDISLPFNQADSALKSKVHNLYANTGSIVYLDPDDDIYEVIVKGGRVNVARNFTSLWSASVDLARLP